MEFFSFLKALSYIMKFFSLLKSSIYDYIMEFARLGWALLYGYVTNGFFFLLLHIFVVCLIRRSWKEITAEETALNNWFTKSKQSGERTQEQIPKQADANEHKTVNILDQFIEECEELGQQGILVPITDFSDRLDSTVDGLVAKLHDRTNLFLIVGIAGTLFGVFEFAFKSIEALSKGEVPAGERVLKLGEYLSGSMSKAFPVGFMGLALTFISQIITTRPEGRLRKAVGRATLVALKKRQSASRSQAQVIQEAAKAIADGLKPLSDLKGTLEQSIQPVIETFGQRLDDSLKLVENQFEKLESTNKAFQDSVTSLQQDIKSLQNVADSLKTITKDTPKMMELMYKQQLKHLEVYEEQISQAKKINETLDISVKEINQLNQNILTRTQSTFDVIRENSMKSWDKMSDDFRDKMKTDYEELFSVVAARYKEISDGLNSTLSQLNEVTTGISGLLKNVANLPDDITGKLDKAFDDLNDKSLTHWTTTSDKLFGDVQRQYLEYLTNTNTHAKTISDALASAAEDWRRVANNAENIIKDPITGVIAEAKNEIVSGLQRFDDSLNSRIPNILQNTSTLTDNLSEMVTKMNGVQTSLDGWLKNANQSQIVINDMNASLLETLSQIKQIDDTSDRKKIVALLDQALQEMNMANKRLDQLKHSIASIHTGDSPTGTSGRDKKSFFGRLFNR